MILLKNKFLIFKINFMRTLLIAIYLIIFSIQAMAQDQRDIVAQQALQSFKKLLVLQPKQDVTAADTAVLALGTPVSTAIIPLDRLKAYKAGQPASTVIMDVDRLIYPVVSTRTKQVVSSISIERNKERWAAASFGTDKTELQKADSVKGHINNYRLVKILAFNISFIASEEGGSALQFIPLNDDPQRNIIAGRPIAAEKVLEMYVDAANKYNGLPW
jgi:hypothetical protein